MDVSPDLLKPLAAKYIWWKTPEAAVAQPLRVIAQVMEMGDFDDVRWLEEVVGEAGFKAAIRHAEAGWFSPKSWAYWHYRLHLAAPLQVPPLPVRRCE